MSAIAILYLTHGLAAAIGCLVHAILVSGRD